MRRLRFGDGQIEANRAPINVPQTPAKRSSVPLYQSSLTNVHDEVNPEELANALLASIRLFVATGRRARPEGELSAAEIAALMRIKRAGETTSGALARLEGVSPQAMGATIAALEARGLVEREKDVGDARRILLRATDAGRELLAARRDARSALVSKVLAEEFSSHDLATLSAAAPLLERLVEKL